MRIRFWEWSSTRTLSAFGGGGGKPEALIYLGGRVFHPASVPFKALGASFRFAESSSWNKPMVYWVMLEYPSEAEVGLF